MKNVILIFMLCFVGNCLEAQIIEIFGYHLNGKVDTLKFGYEALSSTALDPQLGEKDERNDYLNKTGLYIKQQSEDDETCILDDNGTSIFYQESFVSKVNLRSFNELNDHYFEIEIVNPDSFSTYQILLSDLEDGELDFLKFTYGDCKYDELAEINKNQLNSLDEITMIPKDLSNDQYLNWLEFKFSFITKTINYPIKDELLYPNPCKSELMFDNKGIKLSYEILDFFGRLKERGISKNGKIDVSKLNSGNYLLVNKEINKAMKFIKL